MKADATLNPSAGGYLRGDASLARYLGVCHRTAITLRQRGMPHFRLGRNVLYKAADVDGYLEARRRGE